MREARSNWREVVLICRKCTRKLDGGFGSDGDKSLRKALRKELKLAKGRKAGLALVEVDCLKLCPKDAVTVVLGSAPGRMRAAAKRTPIKQIAAELGLSRPPPPGRNEPGKSAAKTRPKRLKRG